MKRVIVDTSVLVGSIDARDSQHGRAAALVSALDGAGVESLLLDCVAVECIGVLCRRRAERRPPQGPWLDFTPRFPPASLSTAYPLLLDSWSRIVAEVAQSDGRLNVHDALILEFARKERVPFIATFDTDFGGRGVGVIATPDDLARVA